MISAVLYEQTDIPPGMTCDEYRWRRAAGTRPRGVARSLILAVLYPARVFAYLSEPGAAAGDCPAALRISSSLSREHRSARA
jgi:hypothetical protein